MNVGIINSTGAGFFSNFRGSIAAIKRCTDTGLLPYMEWRNNPYTDPTKGSNVWEYYFMPISRIPQNTIVNKYPIEQDFTWRNQPQTREIMHDLIQKWVRLQPTLEHEINKFWEKNMKDHHVLGIHVRLTDKANHPRERMTIVSYENYKHEIDKYIKIYPDTKIFLATDSIDYLESFKNDYGDRLILHPNITRSSGGKSIHHHMRGNGYKKGKDVVTECILLSKCNFLIKGVSNVALCSLFFNKDLDHFNITSKYNGDTREDFIPYKNITEELCQN